MSHLYFSPSLLLLFSKFCLSLNLGFFLLFFLSLQEMAHILAQKQLRSIILSVSLTMPYSFKSLPSSRCLLLCLSLSSSLFGLCLCAKIIPERKVTPDTSAPVSCHWLLSTILIFAHLFPFSPFHALLCVKSDLSLSSSLI